MSDVFASVSLRRVTYDSSQGPRLVSPTPPSSRLTGCEVSRSSSSARRMKTVIFFNAGGTVASGLDAAMWMLRKGSVDASESACCVPDKRRGPSSQTGASPRSGPVPALKTAPGLTAATGLNTIGETSSTCECPRAGYTESGRGIRYTRRGKGGVPWARDWQVRGPCITSPPPSHAKQERKTVERNAQE